MIPDDPPRWHLAHRFKYAIALAAIIGGLAMILPREDDCVSAEIINARVDEQMRSNPRFNELVVRLLIIDQFHQRGLGVCR